MSCERARGHRFAEARLERRLTQDEVARSLGVQAMTVSRWERGEHTPDAEHLIALAHVLGVSPEWLVTGVVHSQIVADSTSEEEVSS